ncbi:hypothetical protein ISF6_4669 [Piscinibacter sakaiensis]|uniref:Uncharacterized protein n=1 Tax=Piscinibacter sakaiensis TaxID=1547922 RepID=A0A0K8NW29_PISS1|nr:hypothetical protein ISF6_4669 [Piscinibacter sakaiensis]
MDSSAPRGRAGGEGRRGSGPLRAAARGRAARERAGWCVTLTRSAAVVQPTG